MLRKKSSTTPVKPVCLLATSKIHKEVQSVLAVRCMEQLHYLNAMVKKDQVIAYEKFFHGDPENENKVSAIERFLKPVEDNLYDHALERFDIGGVVGNDCHSFALKTSTYNGQIGFATFNLGIAFTAKSLAGSTLQLNSDRINQIRTEV